MKIKELRELLFKLDKFVRYNPDKITKKVRTNHFLEDMSLFIHWLDDERVAPTVQKWRHESIPKNLVKIFGLKQMDNKKPKDAIQRNGVTE